MCPCQEERVRPLQREAPGGIHWAASACGILLGRGGGGGGGGPPPLLRGAGPACALALASLTCARWPCMDAAKSSLEFPAFSTFSCSCVSQNQKTQNNTNPQKTQPPKDTHNTPFAALIGNGHLPVKGKSGKSKIVPHLGDPYPTPTKPTHKAKPTT